MDAVTIPVEKYKAAEMLYRRRFDIAADEGVTREEVLMSVAIDQGPDVDSDSEDELSAQELPAQPQQDNTGTEDDPVFLDPIQFHPMAGKDPISEAAIIARIQNPPPKSKDWKKVESSHEFQCKVKIQKLNDKTKSKWYPDRKIEDAKNIDLTISLESAQGCAPRLRLTQDLRRKNQATDEDGTELPAHRSSIDFAFGRTYKSADDISKAPNQIFNLEVDYKQEHPAMISFDTTGATANNLKCLIDFPNGHDRVRNISLNSYESEMTKKLCNLASIPDGDVLHVTIVVRPGKNEKEKHEKGENNIVDELLASLPFKGNVSDLLKKNMTQLSYYQFRHANGKPMAQYGSMAPLFVTYDENHSCLPEPPRNAWQDADEAAIRLANSVHVQHVEDSIILASLEKNRQSVKLITIGEMVLLCITWDKRLRGGLATDERITFPSGTEIEATIYDVKPGDEELDTNSAKPFYASGKVISNLYDISCDAVVAVDKKKAADFAGLTSPLTSFKAATGYKASLTSKIANNSCAAMINAVAKTYARDSSVTQKWPALLNDGGYLAPRDLLDSATCSRKQWDQALATLNNAHKWDKAQRAHINTFLKAPGGMALLTGSSGSGKTEVMLHLMHFCMQVGIKVICSGAQHATLDLIVIKYMAKFPNEELPLRAYTASIESLTTETTEWQADENELLALDLARAELAENNNKRSRLLLTNSIQHRVIETSSRTDMPEMKRKFPSGSENGESVYTDQTLYDFRQIFREGLAAREEHPFSDEEYWKDENDRFNHFKYAYAALRAEVIQNAKILVTTLINAGSNEVSKNFSPDTAVALFSDEAQASPEQPSLIAIASCHYSSKICVWAMYGDPRQGGVTNLTGHRCEDTVDVFYKQSDMSLFRRLCLAGHPVDRLTIQWRQHEKLFKPLNELHYSIRIRTKGSMKGDLQGHTTLMGRIVNLPYSKIATQSDCQKRLLHVIVDSPTMEAKDTNSRANPGFAAYVTGIVLPKVRADFGNTTHENVMLIVPYAKQKELYRRLFAKMRTQGWTDADLPQLFTVDVAHGQEAHLVILDIVNDDYEGFLQDKKRCCVAFGRAKEQMIVISGALAQVEQNTTTQVVRDVTDGDKVKNITLKRPLVHWAGWFVTIKCTHEATPPAFNIPTDLAFYGEDAVEADVESELEDEDAGPSAEVEEDSTAIAEVEPKADEVSAASASAESRKLRLLYQ
jgi:hypothetical protein